MRHDRINCMFLLMVTHVSSCSNESLIHYKFPRDANHVKHSEQDFRPTAAVEINLTNHSVTSLETIAEIDYRVADFVSVIRCNASYNVVAPTGESLRSSTGRIISTHHLELQAAWETALGATDSCRLLGEKVVRQSFSDPSADTGSYFYLFNPCLEKTVHGSEQTQIHCSYQIRSTRDISLRSTLSEENSHRAQEILKHEALLAATAMKFRQQLQMSLYAQESCENNQTTDAIKEARQKALKSLIMTGIAAAIGGVVAGPEGAVETAKKTLQWISDYFGPGTKNNPNQCKPLDNIDNKAREVAAEMDLLAKKISQLRKELTDSQNAL